MRSDFAGDGGGAGAAETDARRTTGDDGGDVAVEFVLSLGGPIPPRWKFDGARAEWGGMVYNGGGAGGEGDVGDAAAVAGIAAAGAREGLDEENKRALLAWSAAAATSSFRS